MKNDIEKRIKGAVWGALVADAASLGLHWLYDQKRIREVAPESPEFRSPNPADYEGVTGYYAHGRKQVGDLRKQLRLQTVPASDEALMEDSGISMALTNEGDFTFASRPESQPKRGDGIERYLYVTGELRDSFVPVGGRPARAGANIPRGDVRRNAVGGRNIALQ